MFASASSLCIFTSLSSHIKSALCIAPSVARPIDCLEPKTSFTFYPGCGTKVGASGQYVYHEAERSGS